MTEPTTGQENILIVCHDILGEKMAGPGIRYFQLARVLSREFAVTLAAPHTSNPLASTNFPIVEYTRGDWKTLAPHARGAKIILIPGLLANEFPAINECGAAIVIDGYDPFLAEWLAASAQSKDQEDAWPSFASLLTPQCLIGDYFICATERQRDWWLGILEANGRINPYTFREDASLRRLVDTVPYGLPGKPPQATRRMIRGVWDGIGESDRVVLWGGGLWNWLDPQTAIRAFARVHAQRQDARLIFPGSMHPNAAMQTMPTETRAARQVAEELGLLDRAVFFGDWVGYEDWQNVLLESDIALTLHRAETLESRLAFRSRVLDYVWAGLPIVATRGDVTSELVEKNGIGISVSCGDVDGVAQAILSLLQTPGSAFDKSFAALRPTMTWERSAQALVAFCRAPHRAPDKATLGNRLGNPYYQTEIDWVHTAKDQLLAENTNLNTELTRTRTELDQSQNERAEFQGQAEMYAAQSKNLAELVRAFQNRRAVRIADWAHRQWTRAIRKST